MADCDVALFCIIVIISNIIAVVFERLISDYNVWAIDFIVIKTAGV